MKSMVVYCMLYLSSMGSPVASGAPGATEAQSGSAGPMKGSTIKNLGLREPARSRPRVTELSVDPSSPSRWRARLVEDSNGQSIHFLIGDQSFEFRPNNRTERLISDTVLSLTTYSRPLIVLRWQYGKADRVYVLDPTLFIRAGSRAVLMFHEFDRLMELAESEDHTRLRILYEQRTSDLTVDEVNAEYVEKVFLWDPRERRSNNP